MEKQLKENVTMSSFGFVRSPEEDFSDDGTRFKVYRINEAPEMHITYVKSSGEYFISARWEPKDIDNNKYLTYDEESKLPHYKSLYALNGVSEISKEDLQNFYNNCIEFAKEYKEALNNIKEIKDDDIIDKINREYQNCLNQYNELINKIKSVDLLDNDNVSDYDVREIRDYLRDMKKTLERYKPENQLKMKQYRRREYMSWPDTEEFFWFAKYIDKIIEKAKGNIVESLKENRQEDVKAIYDLINEKFLTEDIEVDTEEEEVSDGGVILHPENIKDYSKVYCVAIMQDVNNDGNYTCEGLVKYITDYGANMAFDLYEAVLYYSKEKAEALAEVGNEQVDLSNHPWVYYKVLPLSEVPEEIYK